MVMKYTDALVTEENMNTDFKWNGKWVLASRTSGKLILTRLGRTYYSMRSRANKDGTSQKDHPSYVGVGLHKDFKDPQTFCNWAVSQKGWGLGWHLDKDLLGNFEYGPDSCVFLPQEINCAITVRTLAARSKTVGVQLPKGKNRFVALVNIAGKNVRLGSFQTEAEASARYCEFKELYIQMLAEKYRQGLDPRAYEALMKFKVRA